MEVIDYAELHSHTAFSFLDGASQPEEMAAEAGRLGLSALAITDHDGLYGVVRFAQAARSIGLPTVFGSELSLALSGNRGRPILDAPTEAPDPRAQHLVVLARGAAGYARLSRAIGLAHLASSALRLREATPADLPDRPRAAWAPGDPVPTSAAPGPPAT